ncbi:MAG: FAD-binding oxidoreductase [Alphaproteobacteria bacterium]|nr:FAD-binding oxidoreductase [Alphaproteobacteria bacterium]
MSVYEARRKPALRGTAGWNAILPGQPPPVALSGNVSADFAIIGAGFAGLSAALRLRQLAPGAKIVVLEAGRIAEGTQGRNSGFMIDLPHEIQGEDYAGAALGSDREIIDLNRQAIAFAGQAVERFAINKAFFDPAGKVNGAVSAKADGLNHAYARHLSQLGEKSEMLDAKSMHEMTGSRHYISGLYTPGTTMIQPAGYVRGLTEGLRREGVAIFENAPVVKIESRGASWDVSAQGHRISAGKVILANNGHLESFGFATQRLMHIFLFASMTVDLGREALQKLGGQPRWGITPSDPMGTTMRKIDTPLGGNRIITRTCAVFSPGMEVSEASLQRTARTHRKKFDDRFPALADVPMEYSWAGHLCLSRNSVSVMRELDRGLFSACVQNGLGTVRGTLTGIGAAELACGHDSAITRHFTAEAEPSKLPPPPLSTIGANLYLRWKEHLATND